MTETENRPLNSAQSDAIAEALKLKSKPTGAKVPKVKKDKKKKNLKDVDPNFLEGNVNVDSLSVNADDDMGSKPLKKRAKIGGPPAGPPPTTITTTAAPTPTSSAKAIPSLNLSKLTTPAGSAPTATSASASALSMPPLPSSIPPPPPNSAASSLPRKRSSVGVRLSLTSIPEDLGQQIEAAQGEKSLEDQAKWQLFRDSDDQPYYLHSETGESRWAYSSDETWMEVEDTESGCTYLEHSVTGDTKWKKAETTVWEEMKDPITKQHYFYSHTAKDSQWSAPLWLDFIDTETGCLYYLNTKTNESAWKKPDDFVETVDTASESVAGAAASVRLSLASNPATTPLTTTTPSVMETPRNLPMATPRIIQQPPKPSMGGKRSAVAGPATVTGEVQYSMQKRPKTAPPKEPRDVAGELQTEIDVTEASG
ncbi:hypothetical protein TrVE_jg1283 [Triparma verrucosa]|uniref:WW domain-containing protein n=1 Tax=Triparma verrucosa TaxID=1606542 RepID=A0A9W7BPN1_9STRA|nr:hypothetical protein TrVE_jg1283 [Triparma verrucosa]